MGSLGEVWDEIESQSFEDKWRESRRFGVVGLEDMQSRVPDLADEIGVSGGSQTAAVEPMGFLDDEQFDAFTEARQESPVMRFDPASKENVVDKEAVPEDELPPDPMEVHESRSEYAQQQDENRDARVTTDPRKYADDPDSWDFPGVDTGPKFRSTYGENLSANRLEKVEDAARGDGPDQLSDLFPRI